MTAALSGAALDAWIRNVCPNCLHRPRTPGFRTCSPCFYRPDVHRVRWSDQPPCGAVCPHGRTGWCEDCPPRTTVDLEETRP